MNQKLLTLALAGFTALPVIATSAVNDARADVVIKANARVRIGGRARVRLRRPRVRVRRPRVIVRPRRSYRLHVGSGFYYGWRYAAPPPPRACRYECAPRVYTRPTYRRPVAVYAHRPRFKRFGIGLFAGGMNVEDREASTDIGLLGRFRLTRSLALEGEIAKSEIEDGSRIDRRVGAALLYDFAANRRLSPHILAGAGVVRSDIESVDMSADQVYGEVGVGLGLRLGRTLELAADIRAGQREVSSDEPVLRVSSPEGTSPIQENENYTRARISAILYF